MSIAKRSILICIVFVSCVGCDQTTKRIALSMLPETQTISYLGDTLRLQFVHNQGAFLSLGSSLPETWRYVLFIVGSGILLFGALAYTFVSKPGRPSVVLALALIFAGGVSNLFDRITNGGVVIDFLNVGIGPLRTGIFNIADMAIFGGLFIFIFAKCFTLTVQKSRMPQIQGVKGEAE